MDEGSWATRRRQVHIHSEARPGCLLGEYNCSCLCSWQIGNGEAICVRVMSQSRLEGYHKSSTLKWRDGAFPRKSAAASSPGAHLYKSTSSTTKGRMLGLMYVGRKLLWLEFHKQQYSQFPAVMKAHVGRRPWSLRTIAA